MKTIKKISNKKGKEYFDLYLQTKEKLGWTKALKYLKLAVKCKYTDAYEQLGLCYRYGNGVKKDLVKAAYYFKLAADKDNAAAQFHLGCCYFRGEGVPVDFKKAIHYCELAAKHKDFMCCGEAKEFAATWKKLIKSKK